MRKDIVIHEDKNLKITKHSSGGRNIPKSYSIELFKRFGYGWPRKLRMSVDELFDLTEILDDLCDHIEDQESTSR